MKDWSERLTDRTVLYDLGFFRSVSLSNVTHVYRYFVSPVTCGNADEKVWGTGWIEMVRRKRISS